MKPGQYLLVLCCLLSLAGKAQTRAYDISTPLHFEPVGVNKVLCMKNGYTLLFHFEAGKPIEVNVFDTAHKRVATTHPDCNVLDILDMKTLIFKGLYDIGGEAVLFAEQQNSGRHSLVRVRINGGNGRLIEEKTIGKSRSMAKPAKFYVMKGKGENEYAVLYANDVPQFRECELHITYYNRSHESYKEVPLIVDRKKYDYLDVTGAEWLADGICVSLGLSTLVMNGTGEKVRTVSVGAVRQLDALSEGVGSSLENASVYDHHLAIYFIPRDSARAATRLIDVSQDVYPYYANASYNSFAKTVNMVLLSYRDALYRYGLELRPTSLVTNLFLRLDEDNLAANYTWMNNKLANKSLKERTDTNNFFKGLPLKLFTNENGLSALVSESFTRYQNTETSVRPNVYETFFGDICVTLFDDDGKELWGTVLPKSQYLKSYRHYYNPADISRRWQEQVLLNDLPPQIYNRQFASCNTYSQGSNLYVVYNDYSKNLKNSIEEPGDTVFTFDHTNTCYYKIDRKKEVTKHYMFGDPMVKEYKASFIEGADFDDQRGVYAALIQYKRSDYLSLRMAWRRLED